VKIVSPGRSEDAFLSHRIYPLTRQHDFEGTPPKFVDKDAYSIGREIGSPDLEAGSLVAQETLAVLPAPKLRSVRVETDSRFFRSAQHPCFVPTDRNGKRFAVPRQFWEARRSYLTDYEGDIAELGSRFRSVSPPIQTGRTVRLFKLP